MSYLIANPAGALVAARVFMGTFFLYESTGQIAKGWIGGDGLHRMLSSALRDNSVPPPYRYFLQHVVSDMISCSRRS